MTTQHLCWVESAIYMTLTAGEECIYIYINMYVQMDCMEIYTKHDLYFLPEKDTTHYNEDTRNLQKEPSTYCPLSLCSSFFVSKSNPNPASSYKFGSN